MNNYPLPLPKNEKQMLMDVITHYNADNRAVDIHGNCRYRTENGRACAIGRYLTDEEAAYYDQHNDKFGGKAVNVFYNGYDVAKDKNWAIHPSFATYLQSLHDLRSYWNAYGLSDTGMKYVKEITNTFNITLDENDFQLINSQNNN